MRVLLSTRGSRGDVEPMAALAVRLRDLDAEVRVCAPPDEEFAELLARVDVPLVPVGQSQRSLVEGAARFKPEDVSQRAAEMVAVTFDAVASAAAEGGDVVVATGMFPAVAERGRPHHGGAGTTTAAALAGAPQVVPQVVDQPYYARRVAELGIGVAHDGPVPPAESLSAALGVVLSAETRARAAAVAGEVRDDGAMVAAKLLFEETQ